MRPLTLDDILRAEEYEQQRAAIRAAVMKEKNRRRLSVGENVTFLFENFDTLRYQVQEMVRVEQIQSQPGVRHEISTYNELMPGPHELSATMMLEYPDPEERGVALQKLVGLQDHTFLVIGDIRRAGIFDQRQFETLRISSVQFVRFNIGERAPDEFKRLCDTGQVAIEIDHAEMQRRTLIEGEIAVALWEDLSRSELERGWAKTHKTTAEASVDPAQVNRALADVVANQLATSDEALEMFDAIAGMIAPDAPAVQAIADLVAKTRAHREALVPILKSLE